MDILNRRVIEASSKKTAKALLSSVLVVIFLTVYYDIFSQFWLFLSPPSIYLGFVDLVPILLDILVVTIGTVLIYFIIRYLGS